jgi:hypothetical protein
MYYIWKENKRSPLLDGRKLNTHLIYINQTRLDQAVTTQDTLDVISNTAVATS